MKTKRWLVPVLILILTIAFSAPALAGPPMNLIVNGDFEAGNTGFTSDFTYVPITSQSSMYPPSIYSIDTDPNLGHNNWASFGDHTTGDGNMMIVNGHVADPIAVVWEQEVMIPPRAVICTPVESSFELLAGQHMLVGHVVVNVVDGNICVRFVLDGDALADGWLITETHVAIADDVDGIPHTKKGNSIPGLFPLGESFDPGVPEAGSYCVPVGDMEAPFIIAAHAVVERRECAIIAEAGSADFISDPTTMVTVGNIDGALYPHPAVPATAADGYNANTWPNATGSNGWATPSPMWIWESDPEVSPNAGDIVTFEKTFDIPGVPADSYLKIAVDNGYAVWMNGHFIGADNLLEGVGGLPNPSPTEAELRAALVDLTQPYVDTSTWQTVGNFMIPAAYMQTGMNTLKILGVNESFVDNSGYPTVPSGKNPGGLVYYLDARWDELTECTVTDETAWGDGERFTPKNWATYIEYTPDCIPEEVPRDFDLSFWAANSYHENPASLEVSIDGDIVGMLNLPSGETGVWYQFMYTVADPDPGPMVIRIKDATGIYHGDDFVIDDICLMEVP